ncbi:MAG: hypothetical protein ABWY66_02615 [Xanthobacteraceae bacterium]|jgi:lipopolysaccharide export LptBFGC system permease protein LptF|nr:hypothetical protein [Xanthobacteraceae bacterium]
MPNECQPNEYLRHFPDDGTPTSIRREALKQALENRKFEIELYWKRATYFWAFIAAAFAAYFVLQGNSQNASMTYVVACLGLFFIFSVVFCESRKQVLATKLGDACRPFGKRDQWAALQNNPSTV